MKQVKRSDIPLLVSIKEKEGHMQRIQSKVAIALSEVPDEGASELGYAFMEQLDTLNQIKSMEFSICSDHRDDI